MTPARSVAIRAESLIKDYHPDWHRPGRRALDGVSFAVLPGTVCGLVGPNGSGKSTTLKILAGLVRADAGRAEIAGRSAADAVRLGLVGFLPDPPAWPDFATAGAWLRRLARLSGLTKAAATAAAEGALGAAGLASASSRRVGEFSQGLRRRFGVAQAVVGDPAVILLDEPGSGLDPRALEQLGRVLRALADAGRTVLLTSHLLPQVEELCDQVVLLGSGRVLFDGRRERVAAAGGLNRLYLERAPA